MKIFILKLPVTLLALLMMVTLSAQPRRITTAHIHSHNDYANDTAFFMAYHQHVGSIEADIFLKDGELFVAHHAHEIQQDRTLKSLYLSPLRNMTRENNGAVYRTGQPLQILVDIKSEGKATLAKFIEQLKEYPELTQKNAGITFVISGNRPQPSAWSSYPAYIWFDGRPAEDYSQEALSRVALISAPFPHYSSWRGTEDMPTADTEKIIAVIAEAHSKNKKLRFWASPDNARAWEYLILQGADYIGTDQVPALASFIKTHP